MFDIRYEVDKFRSNFMLNFVKRLPNRLLYWAFIRVAAYSTTTPQRSHLTPHEVSVMDALQDWPLKSAGHNSQ